MLLLVAGWAATLAVAAVSTVQIRKMARVELLPATPPPPSAGFSDAHRLGWAVGGGVALVMSAAAPAEGARALAAQAFLLAATVGGFLAGSAAPAALQRAVHPLITCALAANAAAALLGAVSGAGWEGTLRLYLTKGHGAAGAGDLLMAFLHSVILSFGFRVFAQRALMRRHFVEIAGTIGITSVFSLFATAGLGAALGLPPTLVLALAPRSVTVALALPMGALLGAGAQASLTAAAVVLTGLIGANCAQPMLSALGFRDPVVRGLATAGSSHGLGTAALAAKEPQALPVAALAYATMGIVSSVLVALPPVRAALLLAAGGA
jgi:putative effector of murein hydrolase